jgi:putative transposase
VRQRLYPTPEQVAVMVEHCHQARFVFNLGLEQRAWYGGRRRPAGRVTVGSQMRDLAVLRADLDWLRAGSSVVQQAALRDLDRAFANFYAGRARYPRFKKRDDRNGGFVVRDLTVHRLNRRNGVVLVPKVGLVRFRLSGLWSQVASASSARVTLRNGQWHVSFTTRPPARIVAGTGALVGIDRGVSNTLALSDGALLSVPSLTAAEQARFVLLQRRLARQVKGSARRRRTLDALAVLRGRLSNRRTDWVEQTTTDLARAYDGLAIENLQVANMVRRPKAKPDPDRPGQFLPNGARAKAALNKAIHASCWTQFATRLEHKSLVVTVPARYSSQECRQCRHITADNRKSQAVFACVVCGHTNHADTNAALNVLHRGQAALAAHLHSTAGTTSTTGTTGTTGTSAREHDNPRTFGGSDASARPHRGRPRQATRAA